MILYISMAMENSKKLNLIGVILLLTATIAWGTSFFILKSTIEEVPTFYVLAIRFLTAAIGFGLIFIKKLKTLTFSAFLKGVTVGVFLTCAYVTQSLGLERTTPGRNAFLTSSYCVICPFLLWLLFKKKPKSYNVFAALCCIVGVGFVALSGDTGAGNNLLGDGLTLIGALFYAFQIIFIDKFQKDGLETAHLLFSEILTVGVSMLVLTLIFELPVNGISGYALNGEQLLKIGYLAFICTLFAQFAQTLGQKFTSANQSSLILSLESVFGVLFSVVFADEKLTLWLIIGFIIIFISMLISELKFDPIKLLKRKKYDNTEE